MSQQAHVSIGFQGGQVLAVRLADDALIALNKALGTQGWHEIDGADGPIRIDLGQVVYVSAENEEARVGFG
ncbi:MAG TPA: hypothetical protein VGD00_00975 [Solirubrobacteraceae bacterium]|jgi:hypothetical protein